MDDITSAIINNGKFLLNLPNSTDTYNLSFGEMLIVADMSIFLINAEKKIAGCTHPFIGDVVLLRTDPQELYEAILAVIKLLEPDALEAENVICLW